MMSRQEAVPPVKRETGCSAVVRATFSLGNNQSCTASTRISTQKCTDRELECRQLVGRSFATCQKRKLVAA